MKKSHEEYLKLAIAVSQKARDEGNTPFGAILVGPDGEVLMEQGNIENTQNRRIGHAETTLADRASQAYGRDFLQSCTLYTSAEPCCMCAGAIYWTGIGTVVYAMSERQLLELTGSDEKNPTLDLPCREVFARGQRKIEVLGPFPELAGLAAQAQAGYWNK